MKELRTNIQNKEDELSNTKLQLKESKENIKIKDSNIDDLSKTKDNL